MCPGEEAFLGDLDPQDPAFMPLHDTLDSDQFDQRDNVSGFPLDPESSADWEFSFPVSESGEFEGRPGGKKLKWIQEHCTTYLPRLTQTKILSSRCGLRCPLDECRRRRTRGVIREALR